MLKFRRKMQSESVRAADFCLWIAVFCSISSTVLMALWGNERMARLVAFSLCVPSNLIWVSKGWRTHCLPLCCWNSALLLMNLIGVLKCWL